MPDARMRAATTTESLIEAIRAIAASLAEQPLVRGATEAGRFIDKAYRGHMGEESSPWAGPAEGQLVAGLPDAARRLGFTQEGFHGTTRNINRGFQVSESGGLPSQAVFVSPEASTANRYASMGKNANGVRVSDVRGELPTGSNVLPVAVRPGRTLDLSPIDFEALQHVSSAGTPHFEAYAKMLPDSHARVVARGLRVAEDYGLNPADIMGSLRQRYDTIRSMAKGMGESEIAVLNPKDIRSVFAKFDPRQSDSSDLLASILAGAGLGAASRAPRPPTFEDMR